MQPSGRSAGKSPRALPVSTQHLIAPLFDMLLAPADTDARRVVRVWAGSV